MPTLRARLSVEVYISKIGYVCLKQEDPIDRDEHLIMIEPRDVPLIIEWLQQAVAQNPTLPKDQEEDE